MSFKSKSKNSNLLILILPLLIGIISFIINKNYITSVYESLNKPPLSPPEYIFSVVWTILYILLGISGYYINKAHFNSIDKTNAMLIFFTQLVLNFIYIFIFFRLNMYGLALLITLLLFTSSIITFLMFKKINKFASYLVIPYVIWLAFALYLNTGIVILNS